MSYSPIDPARSEVGIVARCDAHAVLLEAVIGVDDDVVVVR